MFAFVPPEAGLRRNLSEALRLLRIECEGGFEAPSMGPSSAGPRFSPEQKTGPEGEHLSFRLKRL